MQENIWIADRGYGTGMALAFQGDENFIRRSVNFAMNFLITPRSQIKQHTPSFVIINTSMDELKKAFKREGFCIGMQKLRAKYPITELEEDDFPEDFEQRVNEFISKTLTGDKTAVDPLACVEDDPQLEIEAEEFANEYAEKQMQNIRFEDFMRKISRAGLREHEFIEKPA